MALLKIDDHCPHRYRPRAARPCLLRPPDSHPLCAIPVVGPGCSEGRDPCEWRFLAHREISLPPNSRKFERICGSSVVRTLCKHSNAQSTTPTPTPRLTVLQRVELLDAERQCHLHGNDAANRCGMDRFPNQKRGVSRPIGQAAVSVTSALRDVHGMRARGFSRRRERHGE